MIILIKFLFIFSIIIAKEHVSDSSPNPTDSILWVTKASAPGGRYWCPGVGIVRDTIYLLGGRGNGGYANSVRSMYAYLPLNDTWITNLPTLLTTRRAGGGGQVGNKIYICGGRDSTHTTLNTCEEFDVDTKIITQKVSMPSGRWACAGTAIGDKIYIFGSENESDELFEYNTTANSWRIIMPTYRSQGRGWNAVASAEGKLYVCGGNHQDNILDDCWEFDPITEFWTQKADMPGPRIYHTAIGFDDDIFVVGGASSSAGSGDSIVYRYKISSNSWITETPVTTPRGSSMLAIHDGWLYVMCGTGPLGPPGINEAARIYPPGIEENSTLDTDHLTPEIYPNPAKGVVSVRCPLSVKEIKIFNVSGKLIKEIASASGFASQSIGTRSALRNDQTGEVKISLKGINPGVYFLGIGKEVKKFLVVK